MAELILVASVLKDSHRLICKEPPGDLENGRHVAADDDDQRRSGRQLPLHRILDQRGQARPRRAGLRVKTAFEGESASLG